MKNYLLGLLFFISFTALSQNNHIVRTNDGRRVLLKADFTWEYIDLEAPKNYTPEAKTTLSKENSCHIAADFTEPVLNKKIQNQLKKGRATISHIKKKVAKDYNCAIEDITLLSVKENLKTGTYNFCANGKKVAYKRNGHNVAKKIKIRLD